VIFLDTNVLSEPMNRAPNDGVVRWLNRHETATVVSSVVIAEVGYGIYAVKPEERSPRHLKQFIAIRDRYADRTFDFDMASALIYAQLMGSRKLAGKTTSMADGMIASIALRHKAALATRNISDFTGMGLELVNPWD
jgi:toxin FitB